MESASRSSEVNLSFERSMIESAYTKCKSSLISLPFTRCCTQSKHSFEKSISGLLFVNFMITCASLKWWRTAFCIVSCVEVALYEREHWLAFKSTHLVKVSIEDTEGNLDIIYGEV